MSKGEKLDDSQMFAELAKEFHELVTNKGELCKSLEHFLDNTIDEVTLGIIFDLHRKHKTRAYQVDPSVEDEPGDEEADVFAPDMRKPQNCACGVCKRAIAANRFAAHLEVCMGLRAPRGLRTAARHAASSQDADSSLSSVPSDDENDAIWNSAGKRGKVRKKRTKGKGKGEEGGPREGRRADR